MYRSLAALAALFTIVSFAQVNTGSLSGSVSDPSGAAVPNAKIILRNQNTGVENTSLSGEGGLFRFPFVNPGTYNVKVEATGFRSYEAKGAVVELGKESSLAVKLELGTTTETVVVEGSLPLVESETAQVTNVVDKEKILVMPRVDRGLDNLALLSPGVQPGIGFTNTNGVSISVNGQRTRANNFLLEGQDNNDPSIGGPGLFMSNPEVVSEFSIITNQFSAEYGRNAGAIVNIGLRSGTNDFHINGNYRHRNDQALGTLTNFQRRAPAVPGVPKVAPKWIDNYLGGSVTGPVIKNKWFFMGYGYNNKIRRNARSEAGAGSLTPTPNGLRTLTQAFPNSPTVKALAELGPFGSNVRLGTTSFVPTSTVNVTGPAGQTVPVEMGRIIRSFGQPYDSLEWGTRQDYTINDKQRISARYLFQERVTQAASGSGLTGYLVDTPGKTHNVGGTHIWTITPSLVNEARFSYQKNGFFFEGGPSFPFSEIGKNIANFGFQNGNLGFGLATNLPQFREVKRMQFQNSISKQAGRHFLKMGVQIARDNIFLGFLPNVNGAYQFADLQGFVNNSPVVFTGAAGEAIQNPKQIDQFYFVQDDWKISNNLTLNIGLRYEYSGQPINVLNDITVARESNAQTALFDRNLPLDQRTVTRLNPDRNNFQPRLGFAYKVGSTSGPLSWLFGNESVLRGGWSMMNEPSFYNMLLNTQSSAPAVLLYSLTGSAVPVTSDFTGSNLQRLAQPPRGGDPRRLNQTTFDGDFRLPLVQSWSFGMQRRLGSKQGFEVRYVGTKGTDQFATVNGNPLISAFTTNGWSNLVPSGITAGVNAACANCAGRQNPNFALLRTRNNAAFNQYHGLQTRYDARLFNQLLIGSSYTWSKNMDNVSEIFEAAGSGSVAIAQNPFDIKNGERALSNIDLKHVWTMNFNWDIPGFKNNKRSIGGYLLGGWELAGITSWYGGRPMQPLQNNSGAGTINDRTFMSSFIGRADHVRPFSGNANAPLNTVGRILASGQMVNYFNNAQNVGFNDVRWIYNDANSARVLGTPFGIGRNVLRGPQTFTQDLSFYKNVQVTERLRMQFRVEGTNITNHTNLQIPTLIPEAGLTAFLNPQEVEHTGNRIITVGMRFFW
jgi:hypothetical protein